MKNIGILLTIMMLSIASVGQNKITGLVQAEAPLEAVTVSLLRSKDSGLVKTELTNRQGRFEFLNIKNGDFLLHFSATGFKASYSGILTVENNDVVAPAVRLLPQAKEMAAVTVTAKRPPIEQKIDKLVINVDASPSNAGATAMEVLEKSPGIIVNNDGVISLKGKPGVIIMMDGKPTYLSEADLANLLKNTPASAIDQIEIMSNPSSRFDASGNSGVINIKTKKGLKTGWNGSIMLGASAGFLKRGDALYVNPRSQNSVNFNYRKDKINFFGNYNPNFNKGQNEMRLVRRFYNEDGSLNSYADQVTNFLGRNNNHTAKLGVDYFIDNKNVVGVVFTGFGFWGQPEPETSSLIKDADGGVLSGLNSATRNRIAFRNYTSNINYKHSFDSAGREVSVDLDYVRYDNSVDMMLTTKVLDKFGEQTEQTQLKGNLPSGIDIYSIKADYVHPLNKNTKIETGIKSNFIRNNNLVNYFRSEGAGWVTDARSNHFIYEENINAAYVNLGTKLSEKWTAQAGLRAENTNTSGHQVISDSTFKRNYTNLFPSAFVSYAADKNNQLTLSYSRRVTRPNYQHLNPFIYFLDSLTYQKGNPFLLPQFSNNIELGHTFKNKFITSVNYSRTTDVISELLVQNTEEKTTYLTRENIAAFRNIGLSVTAPVKWSPWWSTSFFGNVFNNHYKGKYNAFDIDLSNTAFLVNITNSFTLPRGFGAELSGFYRSRTVDQMLIMDPMYQMNIAFQKTLMKGKSTVRLNIRDPFGWQRFGAVSRYGNVNVSLNNRWDSRQVSASFTYRFGKNTITPSRKRATGVSEELNRAGQGS
ncbi:MAG: TonB-dependent receptor [Chitinophagaceae bacterium]|nr:TonB-dependent receptor [Chitinophagaceae bacterium]MCW5926277.1 TonB-dependent receptor [Chitinophagaceae bacterium]